MQNPQISLEDWLQDFCDPDIIDILDRITTAGKIISEKIKRAPIESLYGLTAQINSHGEEVKTLDMLSNEQFIINLKKSNSVAMMISEEEDTVITANTLDGKYCVT